MGNGLSLLGATLVVTILAAPACSMGPSATEWEDVAGTFTTGINGVNTDVINPDAGSNKLNAVHGPSRPNGGTVDRNNVWAVGDNATILRYNGTSWTQVAPPVGVTANLYDIYILPTPDANNNAGFAVGAGGTIIRLNSASGLWECTGTANTNCPNGSCGAAQGGILNICATLYEIVPVDPLDPNSSLVAVGQSQCVPPDTGPAPPFAPATNPTILMWTSATNSWKKITTGTAPYRLDLTAFPNQHLCGDCGGCVPVGNPGYGGRLYTGLITDYTTSANPTQGGAFESSRLRIHMDLNSGDWDHTSGASCQSPCGAAPYPHYYTSANIGNYALVAGDTDTCVGCPGGTAANFHLFAPPGALLKKIDTGLSAASYGTVRNMDWLQLWGFGIGVGYGDSNGADHTEAQGGGSGAPDAYFALINSPDPNRLPAPGDPGSPNSITYWQKPAAASWPRLNGTFIVAYNEAWAVGDGGTILHWTTPPFTPADLAVSLSVTTSGGWVQVVMSVTNTGGTVLDNLAAQFSLVSGSASLICGPICVTEYCAGTPGCPTTLPPGGPAHFTWSYTLTGCYPVIFSGSATGTDLLTAAPAGPATDSATIPSPPLSFTVVDSHAPAAPGAPGPVTYTIVVTNTGATTITQLVVVDTVSPVVTSQSTTQPGAFPPPVVAHIPGVGTRYIWSAGGLSMTPGSAYNFTVGGTLLPVCAVTPVNNRAYARAVSDCRNSAQVSNLSTFSLPAPPLSFTTAKEQVSAWSIGSPVRYRIIVTNNGSATISRMNVVDTVSPVIVGATTAQPPGFGPPITAGVAGGTRYLWSSGFVNLEPGKSFTFSISGSVGVVCATLPVSNNAVVSAGTACGRQYSITNLVGPSLVTPPVVGLQMLKTQTLNPPSVAPGEVGATVWYRIVAYNSGSATITALTVVDTVHPEINVIATDQPASFAAPTATPVAGGMRYRWSATGVTLFPGKSMTFTLTGLNRLPAAPTTVTNRAWGWASSGCAANDAGSKAVSYPLGPPLSSALAVYAMEAGPNLYRVTTVLTVTNSGSSQLVQTSSFTSYLSTVPAGYVAVSPTDPTPIGLYGLGPGGSQSYTWVGDVPGPLPLTFGACTSATMALTDIMAMTCSQATLTNATSLLGPTLNVATIQACPNSPFNWYFTVTMDVTNNTGLFGTGEDVINITPATVVPPPGASLLSGPSPASIAGPLPDGQSLSGASLGEFTWTFSATGALPFNFTLGATGTTSPGGAPVFGTGAKGTGSSSAAASFLGASLSTASRWNASEGLAGRWEITVIMTLTNTGANKVVGIAPLPPAVMPFGQAWPIPVPPGSLIGVRGWRSGTSFFPSFDGELDSGEPVSFGWTYSATGTAALVFVGEVCAQSQQGAQLVPTYVVASGSIKVVDTGDVGVFLINRNLMRGRTEPLLASFNLKEGGHTTLKVYNSIGQRIKILFEGLAMPRQDYDLVWDGTNDSGERVASGVYYVRLEGKRYILTRKVALIK